MEEKIKKEDVHLEAAAIAQEIASAPEPPAYQYPPVELLKEGSGQTHDGTEEMRQNAERLGDTLKSFGIKATIINVTVDRATGTSVDIPETLMRFFNGFGHITTINSGYTSLKKFLLMQ